MITSLPFSTASYLQKCLNRAIDNANKKKLSNKDNLELFIKVNLRKQLDVFGANLLSYLSSDRVIPPNLVASRLELNLQQTGPDPTPKSAYSVFTKQSPFYLARPLIHIVKHQETLPTICNNRGYKNLTIDEICLWNEIKKTDAVRSSQQLWLYDKSNPIISEIIRVYGINVNMDTLIDPDNFNPFTKNSFTNKTYNFKAVIGAYNEDLSAIVTLYISVTIYSSSALELSYFSLTLKNSFLDIILFAKPYADSSYGSAQQSALGAANTLLEEVIVKEFGAIPGLRNVYICGNPNHSSIRMYGGEYYVKLKSTDVKETSPTAFHTAGNIYLAPVAFKQGSEVAMSILAHELVHVIHFNQGLEQLEEYRGENGEKTDSYRSQTEYAAYTYMACYAKHKSIKNTDIWSNTAYWAKNKAYDQMQHDYINNKVVTIGVDNRFNQFQLIYKNY